MKFRRMEVDLIQRGKRRLGYGALMLGLLGATLALPARASGQSAASLPPSLHDLFAQGVEAQKAGELDEAEKVFQQVLARGGNAWFVHNNLGIVYQMRREHEKAVAQFRTAVRLQPANAAPRILLGASLLALGRINEATVQLQRAVKLQPREPLARQQLARAYHHAGNFRGRVEQYRALVELAPADPEYVYQLGSAYLQLAAWCHRELATLNPDSARIHQSVAENLRVQGHLDLAARAYQRAAQKDPTLPEVHFSLALIYLEQGKPAEAMQELEKELAIVPSSAAARALREKLKAGGQPAQ